MLTQFQILGSKPHLIFSWCILSLQSKSKWNGLSFLAIVNLVTWVFMTLIGFLLLVFLEWSFVGMCLSFLSWLCWVYEFKITSVKDILLHEIEACMGYHCGSLITLVTGDVALITWLRWCLWGSPLSFSTSPLISYSLEGSHFLKSICKDWDLG